MRPMAAPMATAATNYAQPGAGQCARVPWAGDGGRAAHRFTAGSAMKAGRPSVTARIVALTRATLDRPTVPTGDAAAEQRLYESLGRVRFYRTGPGWRARMERRAAFFDRMTGRRRPRSSPICAGSPPRGHAWPSPFRSPRANARRREHALATACGHWPCRQWASRG